MSTRRRISVLPLFIAIAGCGGSTVQTSPDFAAQATDMAISPTGDMAVAGGDMAPSGCGGVYAKSTIAAMRQGAPGCYELDAVVTLAIAPTTSGAKVVTHRQSDKG